MTRLPFTVVIRIDTLERKHSTAPKMDVATLFRHMVFNAAVGNVDDHLKNFWMLAKPGGSSRARV
jgi:serine/threonine protein kinase HipA of HipAB toxin-antitoxin module